MVELRDKLADATRQINAMAGEYQVRNLKDQLVFLKESKRQRERVCVCEREREREKSYVEREREREREKGREKQRQRF